MDDVGSDRLRGIEQIARFIGEGKKAHRLSH
jgi:hypothetical protein